jgi:DNA-binding transcriptional LysR family regulator
MPVMLTSFHENYPDIKIQLDEGSSLDMTYSLLDFKNEVAVIAKAEDLPEVNFFPFSKEEMAVIVAPGHPLTRKETVSFKELAEEPFIMKEKGSGTRKLVEQSFANANCEPNILMETSNTEFIKQLVQRGDGISIVVKEAVALELAEKKLAQLPLKVPQIYLDVSIAYLKDQPLSPPARAFVDTLTKLRAEVNLNQLRAFYQTAKCQNVSVAAEHLFVSQPAVTAQIKLFEEACDLKLFKKKGRSLHLTDEGKMLYSYARKIFEYEKKIEDAVEQMKELKKGSLKLGSARTYARYFMPFLLTGFRDAYPQI